MVYNLFPPDAELYFPIQTILKPHPGYWPEGIEGLLEGMLRKMTLTCKKSMSDNIHVCPPGKGRRKFSQKHWRVLLLTARRIQKNLGVQNSYAHPLKCPSLGLGFSRFVFFSKSHSFVRNLLRLDDVYSSTTSIIKT